MSFSTPSNPAPGFFSVDNIHSSVLEKVVNWCKEHKGQPDPVIKTDVFTQERQRIAFTDYENSFFDVPMSELIELVKAAHNLGIVGLYECACQAVAAQIKGKQPGEVRRILQQRGDLSEAEVREIRSDNPWLESDIDFQDRLDHIAEPINIPTTVLITIFEKLPRADLERLQLVNGRFRDLILGNDFSEEKSPLRRLDVVELGAFTDGHLAWSMEGLFTIREDLSEHLKFTAVQTFRFFEEWEASEDLLRSLIPSRAAWKNARLETAPCFFESLDVFEFALTEVLLCKEISIIRDKQGGSDDLPESFLRLPAVAGCNKLDIHSPRCSLEMEDVIEWLHREPTGKQWDEPRCLAVHARAIDGRRDDLIEQLIRTFYNAQQKREYVLRVCSNRHVDQVRWDQKHRNSVTEEKLVISVEDDDDCGDIIHVFVERY